MRAIRLAMYSTIVMVAAADVAAQAPFQPSRAIFARLFPADPRGRLRAAPPQVPRPVMRERAANRECEGCTSPSGFAHVVIDSPLITDEFLARHSLQSNGGAFGDNQAVADFWYDAVHRRVFTRSLVLHEVEDPADLRLGRAPGTYPNTVDFRAQLEPGTTVGHVGFVRWSQNGFGSYFAAVQGAVRDTGTGYLDLAAVTGASGTTRTGSSYSPEDLIKHVRLHPTGELEVGFETSPDQRPDTSLLVRGNVHIEGSLTVDRPVPVPRLACTVRTASGSGRTASATCDAGELAIGGGGTCASGDIQGSRPLQSGEGPGGWELTCSRAGSHTASVICCAQ